MENRHAVFKWRYEVELQHVINKLIYLETAVKRRVTKKIVLLTEKTQGSFLDSLFNAVLQWYNKLYTLQKFQNIFTIVILFYLNC